MAARSRCSAASTSAPATASPWPPSGKRWRPPASRTVLTYVQSGNIVLDSDESPEALARRIHALIAEQFGLDIAVVARTRDELADVWGATPWAT